MASAAQLTTLGIQAAKPLIDNSEYLTAKGKEKYQKYILNKGRRRSTVDYSNDNERPPRLRGGYMAGGAYDRRSKSAGNRSDSSSSDDDYYSRRSRRSRRKDRHAESSSDSEGSVPPQSRAVTKRSTNGYMTRNPGSQNSQSAYAGGTRSENDRDNDDSSDTEEMMDSEEDEHEMRKKRRQELLTGGIAAVATLNAAANVYNSMKARELRTKQLAQGTITLEEAKRARYKNHLQDAATIGLAALSIKGAYGKWQGTVNKHREFKSHREERLARQERRIAKGISRWNRSSSRERAARMGRRAPGYEQTAEEYKKLGVRERKRPTFNRAFSRSYENVHDPYQYPGYGRSYGRHRIHGLGSSRGYPHNYDDGDAGTYDHHGDFDGYAADDV